MKMLRGWLYRFLRALVKLFYPKIEVTGQENLPDEPCLIICNHAQMNGPIAGTLYFPEPKYIWCAGEMMHMKEVPAYAYQDFWSGKPKGIRWFYKILSYLIAPLSALIFNEGPSIEVRRDRRIVKTIQDTVSALCDGINVIIFPEHDAPHNNILCEFQDGFASVAKNYYRQTKKELPFVPVYLAPELKKMYIGTPVRFRADAPNKEERQRICDGLMEEISRIAWSLPRHRVVPYNNIPKKDYPYNLPPEVAANEETRC